MNKWNVPWTVQVQIRHCHLQLLILLLLLPSSPEFSLSFIWTEFFLLLFFLFCSSFFPLGIQFL